MGNMKVFEVSLFIPMAVWAFLFSLLSVYSVSLYTTDSKRSTTFSEVAVHKHVNIVRLACNYYSKVKEWIDP